MKKLLAILLTLILVLSLGTCAMAQDETDEQTFTDETTVTVTKKYKLANAGTSSPAETFTLVQVGNGVVTNGEATTAPALGTITGAAYALGDATMDGKEATITIALPTYTSVGVYEYTLKEVAGTTAGVTYYSNDIKLVVTVINDEATGKLRVAAVHTEGEGEEKSDKFPNTYSAGNLNITKTVTGNLGDKDKYFTFTVTLTGETGKDYLESYAVSGGSDVNNPTTIKVGTSATFYLKDGETLTIANLPYGVAYTVEEITPDDYTLSKTNDTGTINADEHTAAFTNHKDSTVDTGITMDSLPYIVIIGIVVLAGAAMFIKRRVSDR